MGRIIDYLMTDGDWEAMQRIQALKAKARLFDSIADITNDLEEEEILELLED